MPLETAWNEIFAANPVAAQTQATFDATLHLFIAGHATEEDQQELIYQLHNACKP